MATGGPANAVFAGSHFGMQFTGTEWFYTGNAGFRCERRPADTSCVGASIPHDETVFTLSARVNESSGVNGLLLIGLNSPGSVADLRADASTGKLSLFYGPAGGGSTLYTTPNRVFVNGVPFLVSVHSSRVANRTAIYVNGVLQLEIQGLVLSPRGDNRPGTGYGGPVLRGAIGEFLWHENLRTEADIVALHREIGIKYDITINVPPAGTTGSTGALVVGPARMRQVVQVFPGRYWLSWHQQKADPVVPVFLEYPDGTTKTVTVVPDLTNTMYPIDKTSPKGAIFEPSLALGWVRYFIPVDVVGDGGSLGVGFVGAVNANRVVAAIQLESEQSDQSALPASFFPTTDLLSAVIADGEDSDGSIFRTRWHRGCEYYCPPGAGKDCASNGDASGLPQRCFFETDFGISLEEIEKGTLIPQAGFARGNFNYRFADVAVNLVGTGLKDCALSNLPSSCYGGSFLQYSLQQTGPYRIRNYEGEAVRASLYTGQIQQAKALLAERYLSNPVSSADRGLIADYWRSELRGRPMDGSFKLRVYDADGLDWNQLEDVQLVLRYRYWTRLN
ncbi:MAG: hypothetical protein QM778_39155 [Myxococcales bacterium]